MFSISQIAELTGISTRTLQYYDEIGLLKPSELSPSGYRLYNEESLQKLQQILFFKELDFKLKEIKEILEMPEFNKLEAFTKQKKLLLIRRNRIDRLVELLSQLEKGEPNMSFKEFDMSEYVNVLEQFKTQYTENIIEHWGSIENFNQLIQRVKDDEPKLARTAIKQYGSIEKYTTAMKYNLEHFSEIVEQSKTIKENADQLLQKNNDLYQQLTSDMTRKPASDEIQDIIHQIVEYSHENLLGIDMGEGYWDMIIESYSNNIAQMITDTKYGTGASCYIAEALHYYFHK